MGFHSQNLNKNVNKLTALGYKVAVAEQQETRNDMENRVRKGPKKEKNAG